MKQAQNLPLPVRDLISRCLLYLRWLGIALWLFLLVATFVFRRPRDAFYHTFHPAIWFTLWAVYGLLLLLTTSRAGAESRAMPALLTLESIVALYFVWLQPGSAGTVLLVVTAWNIAVIYPARPALIWIGVQSLVVGIVHFFMTPSHWMDSTSFFIYFIFRLLSSTAVMFAKQEADSRAHLAHINAQLGATRELLAESSRANERLSISRQLHDTIGHHLTALYLHLEVARNGKDQQQIMEHIDKAQSVSKEILKDVRDVVRSLRDTATLDVDKALNALGDNLPGLTLHLLKPERLRIDDVKKAEAILYCVQEVITNTLRHASAKQLWVKLEEVEGNLQLTAEDDGKGLSSESVPGLGLRGMQERFAEQGGYVHISSKETGAAQLFACLPIGMEGAPSL